MENPYPPLRDVQEAIVGVNSYWTPSDCRYHIDTSGHSTYFVNAIPKSLVWDTNPMHAITNTITNFSDLHSRSIAIQPV